MKKGLFALILLLLVAAGGFAQTTTSIGGGVLLDWSGNNGLEANFMGAKAYVGYRNLSFGGFIFFDATYVEADVSFAYGMITGVEEDLAVGSGMKDIFDDASALQLCFSIMGKYPINMGSVTVFPLVGINYNYVLSLRDKDGKTIDEPGIKSSDFSQFGFLIGGGLDFSFSGNLFLRTEALFQFRLASKIMDDMVDATNYFAGMKVFDTTWGMGPRFKLGFGYRF